MTPKQTNRILALLEAQDTGIPQQTFYTLDEAMRATYSYTSQSDFHDNWAGKVHGDKLVMPNGEIR